ncbi:MAG: hypothetical protein M3P49_07225 [Actinomycetota bacterium]|nr:hypothetical protein [Actinomycetota bacterium]
MKEQKLDGRTKRALDMAIARKQVSQESYQAVLAGTLTLQEAKAMGRDGAPATDGSGGPWTATETATETLGRSGTEDTAAPARRCLCGCGQTPKGQKSRFLMGHDARLHGEIKRNLEKDPLLRNERFTDAQRAYARERGLI